MNPLNDGGEPGLGCRWQQFAGGLPRDVAIPATAAGNSHGVDDDAGEVGSVLFGAGRRW